MLLNGAQILIEVLAEQKADIVFGYPGGAVLNIYDELYKNSHRIKHIISAHEQGAAHAADGYARASGKTGVVIATSGPGATNLVTGIANAYLDSVPMVAITGNVAAGLIGKDSFQEVDIVGITQPIVKHNFIVRDVNTLEKTLKEAFFIAETGRKGPVLVDIPKSVQIAMCEYEGGKVEVKSYSTKYFNDMDKAREAILNCQKPYIYCGGGVVAAEAEQDIMELSKRLSAPIGLSMMGLSAIPRSYEMNLGMCGMHGKYAASVAQAEADLIIAAGVRFSDRATGNVKEYASKCTIIHIDIDAAEIGKNVKSRIGLCGDVSQILRELLSDLPEKKNEDWVKKVMEIKEFSRQEVLNQNPPERFSPKNIINLVNTYCDADTVIATDVGQHQMWTAQFFKFESPRTFLTSGGLGAMGYGLGAAIGGCIAVGGRKMAVLFTSDGSFGMNLTEMATAVSQELPLLVVILNNGTLGMVRQWQSMFYDERYSQTTLSRKTDFKKLAEAFGAIGYSAFDLEGLSKALEDYSKRLNITGENKNEGFVPAIIDCHIDIDEKVLPMIPPGGSVKDIVTK